MGEKDTKAKEYLADNERFADLCNYVLFGGDQVITADELEERDTTEILSTLGIGKKQVKAQQKWRDLLKRAVIKYTGEMYIVLIGVENQTEVHYAMPVKNMVYDALNYNSQVQEATAKHREQSEYGLSAEFLSGFHKEDRLTPVITITLYWGEDEWDGPRSLHEMFQKVDERLKPYLPDYRINLLVPQEIKDFHSFRTALGAVLEMIKMSGDEQAMSCLLQNGKRFSSMDNESIEVINTFIGTEIPYNEPEGGNNVCKAWDDHKESGRIEGRIEGRMEEIYASVRDGDYSAARGAEKLGISVQELEKQMAEAGYPLPLVK